MFFKHDHGLGGIIQNHADDAVIYRIAGGNGIDVNFSGTESFANAGQGSGAVFKKQGELLGDLHVQKLADQNRSAMLIDGHFIASAGRYPTARDGKAAWLGSA